MHLLRPTRRTSVLVAGVLIGILASSCSMQDKGGSRVVLKIPNTSTLSSRVGRFTYSWDRACFAMNVTAGDIESTTDTACEIRRGVFSGMVPPNSTLTGEVKRGSARKFELFAFFRTSAAETCPTLTGGFGTLDRKNVYLVGKVDSFDIDSDEVNLSVTVTLPTTATSVYALNSMPASCVATVVPESSVASSQARARVRVPVVSLPGIAFP
ncbi:MAG: hypothetical protein V4760_03000 [Bdellovibrionota bacterium]